MLTRRMASNFGVVLLLQFMVLTAFGRVEDSNQNNDYYRRYYQCLDGWVQRCNRCFLYVDEPLQWVDAQTYCRRLGSDLVTIQNWATNYFTYRIAKYFGRGERTFWIGANDRREEGRFRWSDGTPGSRYSFRFFGRGQPDDRSPGQDCVQMYLRGRRKLTWRDHYCDDERPFICQAEACYEGQFRCDNGKCVSKYAVCDRVNDCGDNSDESGCHRCGGKLEGSQGTFTSPNYPEFYPSDSDCTWKITVPAKSKIELSIDNIALEPGFDYVDVYDGPTLTSKFLKRLHGVRRPNPLLSSGNQMVVRFVSDESVQNVGFSARYKAVTPASCGGQAKVGAGKVHEIKSPNYPLHYPNKAKCIWTISTDPGNVISIVFIDFETEPVDDIVDVTDVTSTTSQSLGKLSGFNTGRTFVSTGSKLIVKFTSDLVNSRRGFKAVIKGGCYLELNRSQGVISSPGFGYSSYPNNLACTWRINEPSGRVVDMMFHFLDTEKDFDIVTVKNGSTSAVVAKYSGNLAKLPSQAWTLLTGSSYLHVLFSSDYSYNKKGFNATFSIGCPALTAPEHGSISPSSRNYGVAVTYSCDPGYNLVGGVKKTCLFGGNWSPGSPRCQEINCGYPGSLENGMLNITGDFKLGSLVAYACYGGFRLEGPSTRTCLKNNSWSGSQPKCINAGCGDPGTPVNGVRDTNSTKVGTEMTFACNKGYRLVGLPMISCVRNGNWTGSIPKCEAIRCAVFQPPLNGRYIIGANKTVPVSVRYGEVLEIGCDNGYSLTGSSVIRCQQDGKFNDTTSRCSDKNECLKRPCKGPGALCKNTDGSYICSCESGFEMAPGAKDTCRDINECLAGNGGCDQNCTNLEGKFRCSCRDGFYLYTGEGENVPEAFRNRTCLGVKCPTPPALVNGIRPYVSTRFPVTLTTQCSVGYLRSGPRAVHCTKAGTWIDSFATCNGVNCGDPGQAINGITNITDGSNYKSVVTYECLTGHMKKLGTFSRECLANETHAAWTGSTLECERKSCGRLSDIKNGVLTYKNGTLYGDKAVYECNEGYSLSGGENERLCNANGLWNGTEPFCIALPCPDPGVPVFGTRSGRLAFGETVRYECSKNGYTIQGDKNRTCIFNAGKGTGWTGKLPTCKDTMRPSFGSTCPGDIKLSLPKKESSMMVSWVAPTATDNSGMRPNVTVSPAISSPLKMTVGRRTVSYVAVDGVGNEASCTFTLEVIDAEPPVTKCPQNINISSDFPVKVHWTKGLAVDNVGVASVQFFPPNGTRFLSDTRNNVTMIATDQSNNTASCLMEVYIKGCGCPSLRGCDVHPINGVASCHVNPPPISCSVFCDTNYTIADNKFAGQLLHCPSGKWNQPTPGCALMKPLLICHKIRLAIKFDKDAIDLYSSPTHVNLRIDQVISHLESLSLSECGNTKLRPDVPTTSLAIFFTLNAWVSVEFNASSPAHLATQKGLASCVKALEDYVQNNSAIISKVVSPFVHVSKNLTFDCLSVKVSANKSCCDGTAANCCPKSHVYGVKGPPATSYCYACTPGMYYNASLNNCQGCPLNTYQGKEGQNSCEPCPAGSGTLNMHSKSCIDHCRPGTFSCDGFGPVCRSCELGEYQPSMKSTGCMKCPTNYTTRSVGAVNISECVAPCGPGTFSSDGFSPCQPCSIGTYQPSSGRVLCYPCPGGGTFGGVPGAVSISECPTNDSCYASPCQNNGTCIPGEYTYTCQCIDGYTGKDCELDVDECASSPCQNGGNCTDEINSYTCTCNPGFTGAHCEIDIDECVSQPCLYGGTCIDGINSVTCNCLPGLTGPFCGTNIDECASMPCMNNGTCFDLRNDYSCFCKAGFEGVNCENETNECLSQPCRNGAECVDLVNEFQCNCKDGFTGSVCEINIDDCYAEPCLNNGTCLDGINDYSCVCQEGYTGKNCSVDIDDCAAMPCKNNGTCLDLVNGYECTCPTGTTGRQCEVNINECESSPCFNNGTCVDKIDSYKCECKAGFEGSRCENETNECIPDPCKYGDCVDLMASYRCQCMAGFIGKDCDTEIDECASFPCENFANCTDQVGDYNCSCLPGFSGKNCDVNINECFPDPCSGNAVNCTDLINGYYCNCKPGYRGRMCEVEIDYCTPNPCRHNSTCSNVEDSDSFRCNCTIGYEGARCEIETNECASNPCQNGGVCKDVVGAFSCSCPTGFVGSRCEVNVDDCVPRNGSVPCNNGGVCIDGVNSFSCRCPITHIGKRCQKEKSPRFDLRFPGGSGSHLRYSNYSSTQTVTVSSWVRYSGKSSSGKFLVLANKVNASSYDVFLEITDSLVRVIPSTGTQFAHPFIKRINDGFWHHVVVSININTGKVEVYKDKQTVISTTVTYIIGRNVFQPTGVLILAQDITSAGIVNPTAASFTGEIGQVGVWNRILSLQERVSLTANCSTNLTDTLVSWIHLSAMKGPNVTTVEPTTCGSNTCPPSFTGQFCETEIDKEPPTVSYCPNATKIVTSSRLQPVFWTEPVFTDNKGVAMISKSHRPGVSLAWGDYVVSYVASDSFGNSASCTFELYVTRYNCAFLKPPRNGAKICGSWESGRFCNSKCYPGYRTPVPHPPYFSCGFTGTWSHGPPSFPENPDNLLPVCSATSPSSVTTSNQVSYGAASCNSAFMASFRNEFIKLMTTIQMHFPICGVSCDFSAISIKCDGVSRKRRSTGGSAATITVVFPVNTTNSENYTQNVQNGLKSGQFNLSVTVDNVAINSTTENGLITTVTVSCKTGSILNSEKKLCILCPPGTYHNVSGNECVECPIGYYQDRNGTLNCTMCPKGSSTFGTASDASSACKEICNAGNFFNATSNKCEICPAGFYQNHTGKMECDYCLSGMTSNPGARSVSDCFEKCGLGSQLVSGDKCQPCPLGTYKASVNESFCSSCLIVNGMQTTTYSEGATSARECKVVCPFGKEPANYGIKCMDCPTGTYKSNKTSRYCISCPVGTSTKVPAAVSSSDCRSITYAVKEIAVIRITSETWSFKLNDVNSTEFRSLATKISKEVEKVYKSKAGFLSVKVTKFQSGSVLSIMELLFDNKMTNRLNLLNVAVSNGSLGALKVDASYKSKGFCSLITCTGKMEECRNNATHGNCECKSGYYRASGSKQCEADCKDDFCKNDGKCQQGPNGRVCVCKTGFSGDQCKQESKKTIVIIVVCVVAALIVLGFIALFIWHKKAQSYRVNKGIHLDNQSSPDRSPAYPMKTYANAGLNVRDEELHGEVDGCTPASPLSFSNSVSKDVDEAD